MSATVSFYRTVTLFVGLTFITANVASAIVTSDFSGSHQIPPGTLVFGLDLDGVVIVELKGENAYTGEPGSIWGTGARLAGTDYILTAGHVIEDALYITALSTFLVDEVRVHFKAGGPDYTAVSLGSGPFGSQIMHHPEYYPLLLAPGRGFHDGGGKGGHSTFFLTPAAPR